MKEDESGLRPGEMYLRVVPTHPDEWIAIELLKAQDSSRSRHNISAQRKRSHISRTFWDRWLAGKSQALRF